MPLSFSKVNNNIIELQETYKKAQPFPYIILDDFLDATDAEEVLREFPKIAEAGWIHYLHINEKKHGLNKTDTYFTCIKTCSQRGFELKPNHMQAHKIYNEQ